jgi:hypothetical protein
VSTSVSSIAGRQRSFEAAHSIHIDAALSIAVCTHRAAHSDPFGPDSGNYVYIAFGKRSCESDPASAVSQEPNKMFEAVAVEPRKQVASILYAGINQQDRKLMLDDERGDSPNRRRSGTFPVGVSRWYDC